ncbi:MAG: flavin reductase family protein [Candidatus ainarchaeum sp.]|nr:flavin reductase family protein [Candidatus ainarchaeum sp.]
MVEKLYRLLYPMRVVFVGSGNKEKSNIMAAAWCYPLSFDPPMFGVSISKNRYTYELIEKYKKFSINIPGFGLKEAVWIVGKESGRDLDKIEKAGLSVEFIDNGSPLVKECNSSLDCKLVDNIEMGDHVMFVGKVVNFLKRKEGNGIYQKGAELVEF